MKKFVLIFLALLGFIYLRAQSDGLVPNRYSKYFAQAYELYPSIPMGILEAVAYTNTHFRHIDQRFSSPGNGMPKYWGVMGLVEDGKNYFRENLKLVSKLSNEEIEKIKHDPNTNILAYAEAFAILQRQYNIFSSNPADYIPILTELSEIPYTKENEINNFALNSFLYSVFSFLNSEKYTSYYNLPRYNIDLRKVFGENYDILSSKKVIINDVGIFNQNGKQYINSDKTECPDYNVPHCSWVASPNYSSRDGTAISALVVHTTQGSYSGTIAWFQNPDANASAHYVLRSSDGQITQMVREADKAWHVRTENPYTIGYEHEGYIEEPSWYTDAMYQSSAALARFDCDRYNINPHRMFYRDTLDDGTVLDDGVHVLAGQDYCTKIAGHQHFPNNSHTDPGPYWNWNYYYRLVNQGLGDVVHLTDQTGTFYDSGGPDNNYSDDERKIWIIEPPNAGRITLTFTNFDLEDNYDFLYIYDGNSVFAPLIGRWNTQSPGTIQSSGGAITVEFRSDCATTAAGWEASWTTQPVDNNPPTTHITSTGGTWKTQNFTANFQDQDNIQVDKKFYQVIETDGQNWFANANNGFFADNFDNLQNFWHQTSGTWNIDNSFLVQTDENNSNTNIYAFLNQNISDVYLYEFQAIVYGSGTNRRFGFHFFCDSAQLTNRGNSYFVWFRVDDQVLQFYKVVNDTFHLMNTVNNIITQPNTYYDYKIIYNRITGQTDVYRNNELLASYTYPEPLQNGRYISFRTGNAALKVDNIKVYHSRGSSALITVGPGIQNDITVQNFDTSFCAKIKSIITDQAGNLSDVAYHNLKVDYTPPSDVQIFDGTSNQDIDTLENNTTLSAHWTKSEDPNSSIASYWYSVGTQPGYTDVIDWTNNGTDTAVIINGLSLQNNTVYYFNVKVQNNAGLYSNVSSSDGSYIAGSMTASFYTDDTIICVPQNVHFYNTSQNATNYKWYFEGGTPSVSTEQNPVVNYEQSGTFDVKLVAYNNDDSITLFRTDFINAFAPPVADFDVDQNILYLPNAVASFNNNSQNADSYLWDFGDGTTATEENPQHLYTTTGFYTVSLTAYNNGCPEDNKTYNNFIEVRASASEKTNELDKIVYPNPFTGYFYLTDEHYSVVELLTADGKKVSIKQINDGGIIRIVPIYPLRSGLYLLKVYDGQKIRTYTLMKVD